METEKIVPSPEREFADEKHKDALPEIEETESHSPDPEKQDKQNRHVIIDEDGEEYFTTPVETAKDLITEVIHVTDDPSLNPWTFRTWFLGESSRPLVGCRLTGRRPRSISIRWHPRNNLFLQATNSHCFRHFSCSHKLRPRGVHVLYFASEGLDWNTA
jgi:hypothetical protein